MKILHEMVSMLQAGGRGFEPDEVTGIVTGYALDDLGVEFESR
jgi:hypothetical protein